MVILISDKSEFRMRGMIRNKVGNYAIVKVSVLQEGTVIFNVHVSNNRT